MAEVCELGHVAGTLYACKKCGRSAKFEYSRPEDHVFYCLKVRLPPPPRPRWTLRAFRPGDAVARILRTFGVHRLLQWWTRGEGCANCNARQARLNDWWRRRWSR